MAKDLAQRRCEPCHADTPRLTGAELEEYRAGLSPRWRIEDEHHLEAAFDFPNFASALEFTNRVGRLAEDEGHHPDLLLAWGRVGVKLWTHAIDGLSENDFILAAKIDGLVD